MLTLGSFAQNVGTWTLYPSYNDITAIEPAGQKVYVIASSNLYSYSVKDGLVESYVRNNPLSDIDVKIVVWSQKAQRLLVIYENSNMDVLDNKGNITSMPELMQKQTADDKKVYDACIYDKYAFLATGFGIIKVDLQRCVVEESYRLGGKIENVYIENGRIYGVSAYEFRGHTFHTALNDPNRVNPNSWEEIPWKVSKERNLTDVEDNVNHCHWTTTSKEGYNGLFLTSYTTDADGNRTYSTEGVRPDGPASNHFWRLTLLGDKLYSASGRWSYENYWNIPGEIQVFDGKNWSVIDDTDIKNNVNYSFFDANCITFDPKDSKHFFIGSRSGLYEFRDDKFYTAYNIDNSPIETAVEGDPNAKIYTFITSLLYDDEGYLWVMNTYNTTPLKRLSPSGEWTLFPHSEMTGANKYGRDIQTPFISKTNGKMWFTNTSHSNSALYQYDYKNDKLKQYKTFINEDGTSLQSAMFFGCTEDKNGNIWVASSLGPLYLSKEDIKNGGETFVQHKVPRNDGTNLADYLMNNIRVNRITIDSTNRKWMATESNGVYVISDDCNTELYHFTKENSGLPSNDIYDIVINDNSGTVYIATSKGIAIYQDDITSHTQGELEDDNVWAYPNPVTPDYTGMITIVGLQPGCDVKIVSASGNLVAEGMVTGGSFQWDGKNKAGKRVSSGVYMVNVSTPEGKSGVVTKIAVVR